MKELKTLEDIESDFIGGKMVTLHGHWGNTDRIRLEAINWIKALDKDQKKRKEIINRSIDSGAKEWIKKFFNITEEDLK